MQTVLRRIHREVGITFVYVTHDQGEAFAMSDRIGVMRGGKLLQVATPEDLYRKPVNEFVAQFLGASTRIAGSIVNVEADGQYQVDLPEAGITCVCHGVDGMKIGDRIVAVIRPESIRVHTAGTADGSDAVVGLDAAVDNVTFMGSHYRTMLTNGSVEILAHISSNDARVAVGDRLRAEWNVNNMWVAPAEKEA